MSFGQFAKTVVSNEGFLTLYKGLSAGITRQIFYATSRFGLFEVYRDMWARYRKMDFLGRLVVGCLSGYTKITFTVDTLVPLLLTSVVLLKLLW